MARIHLRSCTPVVGMFLGALGLTLELTIDRVLQEQILAPRALMFEDRQIRWRCLCGDASESSPAGTSFGKPLQVPRASQKPPTSYPEGFDGFNHLRRWMKHRDPMPYRPSWHYDNQYDVWYKMVTNYSVRFLTYEADVLSALAGLAKGFLTTHDCTYYAGLWKEDLHVGLLWYISQNCSLPKKSSLPSWSWISRKGCQIMFAREGPYHRPEEFINVLRFPADEMSDPLDSLTTITPKSLTLTGKLRQLEIKPELVATQKYDNGLWSTAAWISNVRDIESQEELGYVALDSDPNTDRIWQNPVVYCLLCAAQLRTYGHALLCLALVPTDDELNEFRRIGIVEIHDPSWFGLSQSTTEEAISGNGDSTEFDRTISIV